MECLRAGIWEFLVCKLLAGTGIGTRLGKQETIAYDFECAQWKLMIQTIQSVVQ